MATGTHRTTRRQLLTAIGMMGGTAALYQAMTTACRRGRATRPCGNPQR